MKVDIQIISSPTKQTNACVGINFANASYLINCGESTQRIAGQNRFRLSKLKTIFNTQVSWDAVGGIPGLLLSISEIEPKIEDLKLFGPKNLLKFIVSHSEFVKRPEMNLALSEVTDSSHPIYTDENLRVFAAIIYPNGTSPAIIGSSTISSKRQRMLQGMFKTELDSDVANQSDDDVHPRSILSFIFHIPSVPGKMDGKKATELGVEGKDRRKLIAGENVISKTGQIITPEMCVEPRRPGKVIVIDKIILYADCPNLEYLDNFLTNELIQSITDNLDNPISTIIHSCSFQVLESERYARWLKKFPQTTKHLILCNGLHSNNGIFYSSDELLNVLGEISDFFKVHTHKDTAALPDSIVEVDNCRIANNYRSHQLEPSVMEYDAYKSSFNVVKCEEFESTVAELHTNLHGQDSNQDCLDSRYIVTLGTGSCMPGKLRNVSSTLVKLSNGVALFDVGEGTLAQLHRSFPEIEDVLGDLNFIFISHLHADHCVGAFNVLKSWIEFNHKQPKKLCVVCPVPFSEWIKEFASIEGTNLESIYFIDCKSLLESPSDEEKKVLTEAGLSFAKTVRVTHSRLSFGIVMKDAEGFKVTYSGDCRPSVNLVNEGMDSDLLIHEATFDDEKFEEALSKNHSTIGEAIQVGRDMKAKHLLLTHFSQRYPILPPDCDVSRDDGPIIGFAFDLMKVHMKDFWKWKHLAKAFQAKILKE